MRRFIFGQAITGVRGFGCEQGEIEILAARREDIPQGLKPIRAGGTRGPRLKSWRTQKQEPETAAFDATEMVEAEKFAKVLKVNEKGFSMGTVPIP
jgi:hypothetical protein